MINLMILIGLLNPSLVYNVGPGTVQTSPQQIVAMRDARAIATSTISVAAASALDLSQLRKGWTELPGTAFIGQPDEINAWGSAALTDNALIIAGVGGHSSQAPGNVYSLPLSTLKWQKERDGGKIVGASSAIVGQAYVVVDDGPSPRHSYDGIEWLPNIKRVFVGGSYPAFADPKQLPVVDDTLGHSWGPWLYDPANKAYESLADVLPGNYAEADYDPRNGLLYLQNSWRNSITVFDPVKRKVLSMFGLAGYDMWDTTATLTMADTALYLFSGDEGYGISVLLKIDVTDPMNPKQAAWNLNPAVPPGSWGKVYVPFHNPPAQGAFITKRHGLQWHPASKRLAAWAGGPDVIWFDPQAMTFTLEKGAGGPPVPTDAGNGRNGMFGRWRYMPQYDAFIGVQAPGMNAWVWKP